MLKEEILGTEVVKTMHCDKLRKKEICIYVYVYI